MSAQAHTHHCINVQARLSMHMHAHKKENPGFMLGLNYQNGAIGNCSLCARLYSFSCAGVQGIGPLGGGKGQVIDTRTINMLGLFQCILPVQYQRQGLIFAGVYSVRASCSLNINHTHHLFAVRRIANKVYFFIPACSAPATFSRMLICAT